MTSADPDMAARFGTLQDRLKIIGPLLDNYRVHFPVWSVVASRLD
jgi:hypothetical protein